MPFTPFHLGAGILASSVTPKRAFSFGVFLVAQGVMDVQPGLGLLLDWDVLHGWTHTYPAAVVLAVLVIALWGLWERVRPQRFDAARVGPVVLMTSALFGTLSHVWLDSQYHAEMASLTPSVLRLVPAGDAAVMTEILCGVAALVGGVIWAVRWLTLRLMRCRQANSERGEYDIEKAIRPPR